MARSPRPTHERSHDAKGLAKRGAERAMPAGKYVDAFPSQREGGYSPVTGRHSTTTASGCER